MIVYCSDSAKFATGNTGLRHDTIKSSPKQSLGVIALPYHYGLNLQYQSPGYSACLFKCRLRPQIRILLYVAPKMEQDKLFLQQQSL